MLFHCKDFDNWLGHPVVESTTATNATLSDSIVNINKNNTINNTITNTIIDTTTYVTIYNPIDTFQYNIQII